MASSMVRNLSGDEAPDTGIDISKEWEELAELNNLKLTSDKKYNEIRDFELLLKDIFKVRFEV